MGLSGDFGKLRKAIAETRSVSKAVDEAERKARDEVENQYVADFAEQRDPWGTAWPATKAGKSPVLVDLASAVVSLSAGKIRIVPEKWWIFHQIGANNMEKRAVLPFSASKWDPPIQAKINDIVVAHFTTTD